MPPLATRQKQFEEKASASYDEQILAELGPARTSARPCSSG